MANSGLYDNFINAAFGGLDSGITINYLTDNIYVGLLGSGYTPNQGTHKHYSDISGSEVSGTGYTAGGQALSGKAITVSGHVTSFTASATTWATSTITNARYAFVYKTTGTAGTSALIGLFDFGSNFSSVANNFTVTWNASGLWQSTVAAFA